MKANSSFISNEVNLDELARLVEDAKNSHDDALSKLSKYVYGKIFGYTYYRVKQREDAEDLTSEVLLKIVRSLKSQKGNFLAWIYRIANNSIIDFYRKRARRPSISLEEIQYDIPAPEPSKPVFTENRMKEVLSHLTQEQADVLTLRFIQDYNNEEVAKIMGKTVGAIKVLQFRALKILRDYFRKEGYVTKY
jgi:RNA polymerase sigma-70 factor (ECF subfamily)